MRWSSLYHTFPDMETISVDATQLQSKCMYLFRPTVRWSSLDHTSPNMETISVDATERHIRYTHTFSFVPILRDIA